MQISRVIPHSSQTPATVHPLSAARSVECLLSNAVDLLLDAESVAKDGRLITLADWIRRSIDELESELLASTAATVKVLEKRQAEERNS